MRSQRKLGEILIDLKVLTHFDVERILESLRRRQRRYKFGQMARDMGLLAEEHILAALAVQMNLLPGIGHMNLRQILDSLQGEAIAG
jgi:hypothetical protein